MNFKVSILEIVLMAYDLLWQEIWSETPLLGVPKKKKIHLQIPENMKECYGWTCLNVEIWKSVLLSMKLLVHNIWHRNLLENVHMPSMLHYSLGNYLNAYNPEWEGFIHKSAGRNVYA